MRTDFDHKLKRYVDLAEERRVNPEGEYADIEEILTEVEEEIMETSADIEIQELQRNKQEIMQNLRDELENIRLDEKVSRGDKGGYRLVQYDDQRGMFVRVGKKRKKISMGDLMTDLQWDKGEEGFELVLDNSVPKGVRKKYVVEKAKVELMDLLNKQIITSELLREDVDGGKKRAYEAVLERIDLPDDELQSGLVVEKMAQNFIKRLTYDLETDIKVESADVFEDVHHKVDFIVSVPGNSKQGVEVVEDSDVDKPQYVGIQFTTNMSRKAEARKLWQIDKVTEEELEKTGLSEILLVRVPGGQIVDVYNKWKKDKGHGGPEHFMPVSMQQDLFRSIMHESMGEEEIEAYCEAIERLNNGENRPSPQRILEDRREEQELAKLQTELDRL